MTKSDWGLGIMQKRVIHTVNSITLCFAKNSGIVLVEMADRAGSGSTEFHIKLEGHGAEWSRQKLYRWNPRMFGSSKHHPDLP